jgi:hypothetical protein
LVTLAGLTVIGKGWYGHARCVNDHHGNGGDSNHGNDGCHSDNFDALSGDYRRLALVRAFLLTLFYGHSYTLSLPVHRPLRSIQVLLMGQDEEASMFIVKGYHGG